MKKNLVLLLSIFVCSACQPEALQLLPPGLESLQIIPLQPSQPQPIPETVIQVSQNPAHTGKFRIVIGGSPQISAGGFRTQKLHGDVNSLKLYLVPGNSGTQTPSYISPLMPKTGQTQMFTFSGVDQGSFYVAASAYQSTTNITNTNGTNYIQVQDSGLQHAFVSSAGGEDPTFPGRVTVTPLNHFLAGTPSLVINLTLVAGP